MPEASTAAATDTVAWAPEPSELVGTGLLTAPIDASPALIYVKDRDGRYLRINRRFAECLGTSAERVLGHTDTELPKGETIDGPRLDTGAPSDTEPRQLEYIVGRFANRPALSVLRFTLVDHAGESIGTCGVAAPAGNAALARAECEQLMALAGMAPPVLVRPMGAAAPEVPPPAEPVAAVEPLRQVEAQADVRLTAALEHERERAERAERALAHERERAQQAEVALAQEREREQAATESLVRERARAEQDATRLAMAIEQERGRAERAEAGLADGRARVEELTARLAKIQREGAGGVDAAALAVAEAERVRVEQEAVRLATALEHERVRAERAETALAEERERSQRAETTLALAGERQQAAGAALAQARERAQQAEEAHGAARAELAAARQETDAQLAEQRARVERAEMALAEERERSQRAENTLALAGERQQAAGAALAQERERAQRAEQAHGAAEAELAATRQEAEAEVAATRQQAEARVAAARQETEAQLADERARAEELTGRLAKMQREGAGDVDGAALAAAEAERVRAEQEAVRLATALEHERVRAERAEKALGDERERSQRAETTLALAGERQQAAGAALAQERERAQRAEEARGAAVAELATTRQQAEAEVAATRQQAEAELAAARQETEAQLAAARQQSEELGRAREQLAAAREDASGVAHDASTLTRVQTELTAARKAADDLELEREELTAALSAAKERAAAMAASALPQPPARSDVGETATPDRVHWGATAQRALAMAVARSADWDSTLREATKAIGVEGGWHAAFAWVLDARSKRLRCAASWIDPEAELGHFETATRQKMLTLRETRLGAAIRSGELRWIEDDPTDSERRWAAVQREGMQLALLVPLRAADGPPVAVLEFLSRDARPPGSALDAAYEAIALELGHVCQLGRLGAEPRWGFGRV